MLRIMTHIEGLLLIHDCVIIPKVGGFVLQNYPASFVVENESFIPSHKEVVFNPTLQHNDGLLTESYMKAYGIDYRKAQLMVAEDVEELRSELFVRHQVMVGVIGTFTTQGESISFEPKKAAPFSISSYGLAELCMPPLQSLRQEMDAKALVTVAERAKDTIYIPISRKFLRVAVASAAAVALFLLISTPVKDVSADTYKASFIPTEVVSKPVTEQPVTGVVASESALLAIQPVSSETEKADVVPAVKVKPEAETLKVVAPDAQHVKMYHIIIASFPSKKQANEYFKTVDREQFANAGIVERGGKIRVYAAKFTDPVKAESYISSLKSDGGHKDAWMFISK